MNDKPLLNVGEGSALGTIEIAPEVIEVIAGIAVSEVGGVASMRGNFATDVAERLGKVNHAKGIKVDLTEEGIVIDTYVVLDFGVSIPKIAQMIQDNTRQALKNMTALEIKEINVHIVGIQMEPTADKEAGENE
ncbi:Asp23/Gls24 family envelope stress response protein [Pontibacillus litoralis]|uniref:Alkaline-shock protein n=1 Tax=Pontibacillus litoralis JSM 072002 TaxID=1385512 RepID=A0A0A5G9V8_9BACI|nr:Asp23/Gls24 family envelope stress response protein [Pontibacillus litoralis]KGX88839.1 hypothetical protein N784_00365 [Pontibacillus litoralis JSM 072002]